MSQKKKQQIPPFSLGHQKWIPAELKHLKRWTNWILFARGGQATKTPFSCAHRCAMDVRDESKYISFEEAAENCNRQTGIGFVLGDGICGLDLDNCFSETHIEPWALEVVKRFNTYTEVSPSGTGLKLFFRGQLPRDPNGKTKHRKAVIVDGEPRGEFEVYDRNRFFTVTGECLNGISDQLEDRQDVLNQFHEENFGKPDSWSSARKRAENSAKCELSDAQLIERIKKSKSGEKFQRLMEGDCSEYQGDYSRADFALMQIIAFWAGPDPDRIISLWLDSKLCDGREEKVNRQDYQDRTCDRVLDSMTQFYNWHKPAPVRLPIKPNANNFIKQVREKNSTRITNVSNLEIGTPENTHNQGEESPGEFDSTDEKLDLPQPIRDWSLPNPMPQPHHQYARTDLGRAEMLLDRWGDRILYCTVRGWLVWDGQKWVEDPDGATVKNLAEETIRSGREPEITDQLSDLPRGARGGQPSERAEWREYCLKSENEVPLKHTLDAAQRKLKCSPSDFDTDPYLLNCANGVVNLKNGEISPHHPAQRFLCVSPTSYNPHASCPEFKRFIEMIFPNDASTHRYLQELAGYFATGTMTERILPLWFGQGSNGKGVLAHTLREVLGSDYAIVAPNTLLVDNSSTQDYDIAEIAGKRLLVLDETDMGAVLRCARAKQLTSNNGKLRGAKKFQHQFEFVNKAKMLIVTNARMRVPDNTPAMWGRLSPLEFKVSFYDSTTGEIGDHEMDRELESRLKRNESEGILNWIVEGAKRMLAQGRIVQSETLIDTRRKYRREQDVLRAFLDDIGAIGSPKMPFNEAKERGFIIPFKQLWDLYQKWDGASHKRTGIQELLLSHGYEIPDQRSIQGRNVKSPVIGIKLPPEGAVVLRSNTTLFDDRSNWSYTSQTIGQNVDHD